MVEAQFRDLHVPVYSASRFPSERMQEAILHPATQEQYVMRLALVETTRDKILT